MVQNASKGWLDDEGTKSARGFLKILAENAKDVKMAIERESEFLYDGGCY